jgi:hypothetical protein
MRSPAAHPLLEHMPAGAKLTVKERAIFLWATIADLIAHHHRSIGSREAGGLGELDQALDALERDHAFLLRGDVFTRDVIETWLDYKRKREVDAIRLRPHPHEFHLYYDI